MEEWIGEEGESVKKEDDGKDKDVVGKSRGKKRREGRREVQEVMFVA